MAITKLEHSVRRKSLLSGSQEKLWWQMTRSPVSVPTANCNRADNQLEIIARGPEKLDRAPATAEPW